VVVTRLPRSSIGAIPAHIGTDASEIQASAVLMGMVIRKMKNLALGPVFIDVLAEAVRS
jgi:hypothetical protein